MTTQTATRTIWDSLVNPAVSARPWLHWDPADAAACIDARGRALPKPLTRDELAELRLAHERWGADSASLASIDRLGDSAARVVVAGQQPGILGGPLYTVYKAMAAIRLARDYAALRPDLKFAPVFWVASEDHDFDEVRRAFWPGSSGGLEEIFADGSAWSPGRAIGALDAHPLGEAIVRRIQGSTHETEFRKPALQLIARAHAEGSSWEDAFCRILLRLFASSGLVVVSPMMKWLRRRGAAILAAEAGRAGESSRAIIARGEELNAAGIESPLHRSPESINVFRFDGDGRRLALRLDGRRVVASLAGGAESEPLPFAESAGELARRIAAEPESFSNNAVTRPLVQDSALPTVAQVVGPGEAAYLAQVEAVYESFDVFAPLRHPRPQLLLAPVNVSRTLAKYEITLETAIETDAHELAREVILRDLDEGAIHEARELRERQLAEVKALQARAAANLSVVRAFERLSQTMEKGYATIEERILYSRQEDERHLTQAMSRVENHLRPRGRPQERVLNPIVPFAVNHGLDWIARLGERIDVAPRAGFRIVDLGESFTGEKEES